jgi:Tfp pilus assembly protein PilE
MFGFTLVEMLVVAGLVGILSIGIGSTFMSTLKGSNRSALQAKMKSQGDFAIASMERTIRSAVKFPTCSGSATDNQGPIVTFAAVGLNGTTQTKMYEFVKTDGQIYSTVDGTTGTVVGSSAQTTGVIRVTSALFECVLGSNINPGVVKITFTLHAVNSDQDIADQTFQTSVAMRNLP